MGPPARPCRGPVRTLCTPRPVTSRPLFQPRRPWAGGPGRAETRVGGNVYVAPRGRREPPSADLRPFGSSPPRPARPRPGLRGATTPPPLNPRRRVRVGPRWKRTRSSTPNQMWLSLTQDIPSSRARASDSGLWLPVSGRPWTHGIPSPATSRGPRRRTSASPPAQPERREKTGRGNPTEKGFFLTSFHFPLRNQTISLPPSFD